MVSVPRKAVRWGVVAGGGTLVVLLFRGLFGKRKPVVVAQPLPEAVHSGMGGALLRLMLQVLPMVLAPWLRSSVLGSGLGEALKRMNPSRIFFRWLGLDKW